jgi:hypothetical protein
MSDTKDFSQQTMARRPLPIATARVNFFVSYTGTDIDWAKWIAWELGREGFTYRLQAEHMPPGTRFINEMGRGLDLADHVVSVFSPAYFESAFAALEIQSAIAEDPTGRARRIIPVRVAACSLPPLLRDLVYIDLVEASDHHQARQALIAGVRAAMIGSYTTINEISHRPTFPPSKSPAPVQQKSSRTRDDRDDGPIRIQFFACDVGRGLDLKAQYMTLRDTLAKSRFKNQFKFKGEFDVTNVNLFKKLNSYRPHVVHISGNQIGGRVLIPAVGGGETVVSDTALAGLLSSLGRDVRLVIIDTCESHACAKRIAEVVPYAMGVKGTIYDHEAIRFYEVFYQAIAAGKSLRDAVGQSVACLQFEKVPQGRIPQLCAKKGYDASQEHFAIGKRQRVGH